MTPTTPPAPDTFRIEPRTARRLVWAFCIMAAVLLLLKIAIIANLDLFWDEAYYWQASERLAIGFADKPFMNALLIHIGTTLFGDTFFGVRIVHMLFGLMLPAGIYWLGRPVVGHRDSLYASAFALIVPIGALQGLQAQPEIVLAVYAIFALGAFERASRIEGPGQTGETGGQTKWWLLFGLLCALGAATHYRFAPFILGIFLYMTLTGVGRAQWGRRGFWLAVLVGLPGLVPLIWFNLETDFASFRYQVVDRNPWTFHWIALIKYWAGQILALNPLLFAAYVAAMVLAVRRWREGNDRAALLAAVAIAYIGGYYLLTPWTDQEHFAVHWPGIGYAPLTLFLPEILRDVWVMGRTKWQKRVARGLVIGVPLSGVAMSLGVLIFLAANIWPQALMPAVLDRMSRLPVQGWSALARETGAHFSALEAEARNRGLPAPVLVAPDYIVASELSFGLARPPGAPRVSAYTLDHPNNVRDGLEFQYEIWKLDQASLVALHAGKPALVLYEVPHYEFHEPERFVKRRLLCNVIRDAEPVGEWVSRGGRRHYQFFRGVIRNAADPGSTTNSLPPAPIDCGVMPAAYIAKPKQGGTVRGQLASVFGWVREAGSKVVSVAAVLDGKVIGEIAPAGDVTSSLRHMTPYAEPEVTYQSFGLPWNPSIHSPGRHVMHLVIRYADGTERSTEKRVFYIPGF